jgi:hypothetical protein
VFVSHGERIRQMLSEGRTIREIADAENFAGRNRRLRAV